MLLALLSVLPLGVAMVLTALADLAPPGRRRGAR